MPAEEEWEDVETNDCESIRLRDWTVARDCVRSFNGVQEEVGQIWHGLADGVMVQT